MLAAFTVSMGYGVVLPLLPYLVERLLGASSDIGRISTSTGLLTGLYTFSLFVFAPVWGHLSDRHGRRVILLIGLVGFGMTMLTFALFESLVAVYAERFLSGVFAAAVTPVALAVIGDLAPTDAARARHLTFVSFAGISGFLLGPMLGIFIAQGSARMLAVIGAPSSLALPLAATSALAFIVALGVMMTGPGSSRWPASPYTKSVAKGTAIWVVPKLLSLAFIVSAGIGVFEVGLALRGKQELELAPYQIALMFTECSLVMIVVQALVFSPWVKPEVTRWFIGPALGVLAAGLFLVPRASDFASMLLVIGAVASSAGVLSPILTYWISTRAGRAQGAQLGRQTAAASLGAAIGSVAGGYMFNISLFPGVSFVFAAVLALLGVALSIGLPKTLVARTADTDGVDVGAELLMAGMSDDRDPRSETSPISPVRSLP